MPNPLIWIGGAAAALLITKVRQRKPFDTGVVEEVQGQGMVAPIKAGALVRPLPATKLTKPAFPRIPVGLGQKGTTRPTIADMGIGHKGPGSYGVQPVQTATSTPVYVNSQVENVHTAPTIKPTTVSPTSTSFIALFRR